MLSRLCAGNGGHGRGRVGPLMDQQSAHLPFGTKEMVLASSLSLPPSARSAFMQPPRATTMSSARSGCSEDFPESVLAPAWALVLSVQAYAQGRCWVPT